MFCFHHALIHARACTYHLRVGKGGTNPEHTCAILLSTSALLEIQISLSLSLSLSLFLSLSSPLPPTIHAHALQGYLWPRETKALKLSFSCLYSSITMNFSWGREHAHPKQNKPWKSPVFELPRQKATNT